MSGAQALRLRLELLGEIANIMDSIKTIALIEAQQSRAVLDSQRNGLVVMESAAAALMPVFSRQASLLVAPARVLIVLGSERGFCGDYNARLLERLRDLDAQDSLQDCYLLPVGYRLYNKLQDHARLLQTVTGASVAAELELTLASILDVLAESPGAGGFESVSVLFHDAENKTVIMRPLLAGLEMDASSPPSPNPPLLNLPPAQMLAELVSEYVYACLYSLLAQSFVAENEQRVHHLRSALDRMEEQRVELTIKQNRLRQEQVTEELEIILLNN